MSQALTADDIWKLFRETDRKFQESERLMRESRLDSDRRIEAAMRESTLSRQETEQAMREVSRRIGDLGNRWGEFVEGLVAPACETLFAERRIPVHKVHQRSRARLPGNRYMEIDLLVVNSTVTVAVEVKSTLRIENIDHHVARLATFREFFPEYAAHRLLGAVAGIVADPAVQRHAMAQGLFVIVQSGTTVCLANPADFQPRVW
ncbi:MAG: DUF3782 domain-containing protein [Magnetococcales bacterium]|nr:DUF3782 domain-containing protein [Magnetococcales bacterium]